eukprot:1157689-Pelagomonas_calceolata.AAC.13
MQNLGSHAHKSSGSAMQPPGQGSTGRAGVDGRANSREEGEQHESAGAGHWSPPPGHTQARLRPGQAQDDRHEAPGQSRRRSGVGNISQGRLWSVLEESAEQERGGPDQEQEGGS